MIPLLLLATVACPAELPWQGTNPCLMPGPCEIRSGQVLQWDHPLGAGLDLFLVCDDYEDCAVFRSLRIDGPDCYRTIWPGVHLPIPPHRHFDRGGPVTLTVQACNDTYGCSDPLVSFILLDPWHVPLQQIN